MTDAAGDWYRHTINELGLSVDVNRRWPLATSSLAGGELIYQHLPGQVGTFFIRYGTAQTIDAFLAGLGGALTTVAILTDEPTAAAGRPARRVTLALREQGGGTYFDEGPVRERSPIVLTRFVLLGLSLRGLPVLIGYRLYEDERATYEPILERVLASVVVIGMS